MCMVMRGVQKMNASTVTSVMLGKFHDDPKTRQEFLALTMRKWRVQPFNRGNDFTCSCVNLRQIYIQWITVFMVLMVNFLNLLFFLMYLSCLNRNKYTLECEIYYCNDSIELQVCPIQMYSENKHCNFIYICASVWFKMTTPTPIQWQQPSSDNSHSHLVFKCMNFWLFLKFIIPA